jgi:hypothetical protein
MWRLDNQISLPTHLMIAGTLLHFRNWPLPGEGRLSEKSGPFAAFCRITGVVSEKHP